MTKKHNILSVFTFSFITLFIFSSCLSIKPETTKAKTKLFETFFVGEEGTQYYIKPLELEKNNSDDILLIDYTFRYKDQIKDSVTTNFSIISSSIVTSINQIAFNKSYSTNNVKLLYKEKVKKGFKTRFSTRMSLKDLHTYFSEDNWEIQVSSEETHTYSSSKKTNKNIKHLRSNIFDLMN